MSTTLPIQRPATPAPACVQCKQPHQSRQHRVIHNQDVSLFANSAPLFDPPYGTTEIRLHNAWFYASLHSPIKAVVDTLEAGHLPWLCPHCAGYPGAANLVAPGAMVLDDQGQQQATTVHSLYERHRREHQASQQQSA